MVYQGTSTCGVARHNELALHILYLNLIVREIEHLYLTRKNHEADTVHFVCI